MLLFKTKCFNLLNVHLDPCLLQWHQMAIISKQNKTQQLKAVRLKIWNDFTFILTCVPDERSSTTVEWLFSFARSRGVLPSYIFNNTLCAVILPKCCDFLQGTLSEWQKLLRKDTLFFTLMWLPLASSIEAISRLPLVAALCRGMSPYCGIEQPIH